MGRHACRSRRSDEADPVTHRAEGDAVRADTKYDNEHITIRQQGTTPIVQHVPAFAWRCWACGWLGLGHTSENAALKEASTHMWNDHQIALCAPIGDEKQYGHPGHRWVHVKGTDSTDRCQRCQDWCGK